MEVVVLPLIIVFLFYFILLRPVIDQQKKHRSDISSLEIGDEVLTTGGFFATVSEINTTEEGPVEIALEAAPGVVLRGTSLAVQQVVTRAADRTPAGASEAAAGRSEET
ncbi:MAG: preprotein translocase subunit YajC [Dehalococcoidia bacterium]|nr:preprotein translocase subunit YajC [Dehalococcoidia bacterium]